jgi:hypothetical protein
MFSFYKNRIPINSSIHESIVTSTHNSIQNHIELFKTIKYKKLLDLDEENKDKKNHINNSINNSINNAINKPINNSNNLEIITIAASSNPNFFGSFLLLSIAGFYFYYIYNKSKH